MDVSHLSLLAIPKIPPPEWDQVETALRSLNGADRCAFAFAPKASPRADNYMLVAGRPHFYTLTVYYSDHLNFRYINTHGDRANVSQIYDDGHLVDEVSDEFVCNDRECVLRVARHFWQFGDLSPEVKWRELTPRNSASDSMDTTC